MGLEETLGYYCDEHGFFKSDLNDGKHCFVFGSNLAGRHGKGAALTARQKWGAQYGIGVGRTGCCYAIPTKDHHLNTLPLSKIERYVEEFISYAVQRPELTFLVTPVGCGLAGYTHEQIKPLFKSAPSNCILPPQWK